MSEILVPAKKRATGSKAVRDVRNEGLIPGVFYAKGADAVPIAASLKALKPIVYTSKSHIVHLEVEGGAKQPCILKDISFDPVTDEIVHFDLLGLIADHPVTVKAPIVLKGQSKAVMAGTGVLEHVTHKVKIECLPAAIPEQIELDVTELEVGDSLHIRDISLPGVKVRLRPETLVAIVNRRRVRASDSPAEGGKK
jgi:large subunit ribosomal protein L25